MRLIAERVWYAVLGVLSVVVTVAVSGVVAALIHTLGLWAYPVSFAMYLGAFATVFVFLLPPGKVAGSGALSRLIKVNDDRFERGIWPSIRKRGVPFFVGVTTIILGPFAAAVLIRFLGISDRKAWHYALVSTVVSVAFWVSVYLGFTDWLTSFIE